MAHQSLPASNNLNSATGAVAPESVDVAEAVALMADLGEAGEDEAEETASADGDEGEEGDEVEAEGGGEGDDTVDEAADEEAEASTEEGEAPEFWSAEDKAAWNAVPAELRPVLKKHEQQRVEVANKKAPDAAALRTHPARPLSTA